MEIYYYYYFIFVLINLIEFGRPRDTIPCLLGDVINWMTANKLKLNTNKTELLIFHSKFRMPPPLSSIAVGTDIIIPTNKAQYRRCFR